jgi:hypothetical protein
LKIITEKYGLSLFVFSSSFSGGPHAFSFCIQNILERLQQEIRAFIWGCPIG